MTAHRVTEADLPRVRAYLTSRMDTAMFPLSNLTRFGLDGDHDYAPSMWVAEPSGPVSGVLTVARNGTVLPAFSKGHDAFLDILRSRPVSAVVGPAPEARPLIAALGLGAAPVSLDRDEPQMTLDLSRLVMPPGDSHLTPLSEAPRALIDDWRAAYEVEALGLDRATAEHQAPAETDGYIAADTHRVLWDGGRPVAMTGFNARLPEIVQIGGVWTPPELRRRGFARRAVALHLAEARAGGVTRATLFAANAHARAAYAALGFEQVGDWTLFLLREPSPV